MTTRFAYPAAYATALGALAFFAAYQGSTYVENVWWGISQWLIGIAAVLTLPASLVVAPVVIYLSYAGGLTDESKVVDALVVTVAAMLSATCNWLFWAFVIRKVQARRRPTQ